MSEITILNKLDALREDIAEMATSVALNNQAHNNLNNELKEHKKDDKWRANRNIAIVAIMFTALGCYVAFKGLDSNNNYTQPTPIVKEINSHDRSSHRN